MTNLPGVLKSYKALHNLSQKELAYILGMAQCNLSKLLRGKYTPQANTLRRVELLTGVPMFKLTDSPEAREEARAMFERFEEVLQHD